MNRAPEILSPFLVLFCTRYPKTTPSPMAPTTDLPPDAWRILSRVPFSSIAGIPAPVPGARHPFFGEMNEYPLQRVPSLRRVLTFHDNRNINHVAVLVAATGELLPEALACHVCANARGKWDGCIIPASPEFIDKYRFGCANCYYHGNRAHCGLDQNCPCKSPALPWSGYAHNTYKLLHRAAKMEGQACSASDIEPETMVSRLGTEATLRLCPKYVDVNICIKSREIWLLEMQSPNSTPCARTT